MLTGGPCEKIPNDMTRCTLTYREAVTLLQRLEADASIDGKIGWTAEELAWSSKYLTETQYAISPPSCAPQKPLAGKVAECIVRRTHTGAKRTSLFTTSQSITTRTLQSLKDQLVSIRNVKNPIIQGLPIEIVVAPNPRGETDVTVSVVSIRTGKK